MKPAFIGIGAQKCASTWIHRVLQDHPQVWVSDPKEIDFFSYHYLNGFQWYERFFDNEDGRPVAGEISPSYFHDPSAPARAHDYHPEFRILVTLRDPVERAYSNHLHEVRLGHYLDEDLSFESGLANNPMYIEQSRYATHLAHWFDVFPRSQVLVLFQEEIRNEPSAEAKKVYDFLGLDSSHQSDILGRKANESYLPRNRVLENTMRAIGETGHRIGLGWVIEGIRKTGLVSLIHDRNRSDIRKFIGPMADDTRLALQAELADEVRMLAALLDRKSLPWNGWRS